MLCHREVPRKLAMVGEYVATRNYLEKARELIGPLPEGLEIYKVSAPRAAAAAGPKIVCWQCGRFVQIGDPVRRIWIRRSGTSWTDRSIRYVDPDCFRGNHPRRRRST
jgi:hypothetical protein